MKDANPHEILAIEGVSKSFGGTTALERLDLSIPEGQFVTFLGPSGCGKSTTLRLLGGFETPDAGRIVLNGEDVTRLPPNRRNVNMVFQDYALFPHMSVRRNIAFGLELKGMGRTAIAARIDELLSFLELTEFADRAPDQLSGGQRQRVALARALAPDPALLLLDEPLGALDAKLRGQVQTELKQIQRRTSKTFLFVTHDQDEALTMSDRVVVMNRGRVEQDGTPEDLYFHPCSRFVAEFIGETNLLEGRVLAPAGERSGFEWNGMRFAGRSSRPGVAAEGEKAGASLRLERIRVTDERPEHGHSVAARISNRIFKGSRIEVELAPVDSPAARLRAYVDTSNQAARQDGKVWASWDADDLAVLAD